MSDFSEQIPDYSAFYHEEDRRCPHCNGDLSKYEDPLANFLLSAADVKYKAIELERNELGVRAFMLQGELHDALKGKEWSNESHLPDKPGWWWYWRDEDDPPAIVEVTYAAGPDEFIVHQTGRDDYELASNIDGWWMEIEQVSSPNTEVCHGSPGAAVGDKKGN